MQKLGIAMLACALALAAAVLAGCSPAGQTSPADGLEPACVERVIDGDTIEVDRGRGSERVRLIGVNTPESVSSDPSRNCVEGTEASEHLKGLLPEGCTVYLQADSSDEDKYGRLLRYVWLDEPKEGGDSEKERLMLNARLVADGWAESWAYEPDTANRRLFDRLEKGANSPFSTGRTAAEASA